MEFVLQAVCVNGCAAVLLITLLLNYRRKHDTGTEESRLFMRMIHSNLFQCIVETITVVIDGKQFFGSVQLSTALNAFLFANNIVFSLLWALYAEEKIRAHGQKKRIGHYLKLVPAGIVVLGAVANLFTPVYFRITEENLYYRASAYPFAFLVNYFYLALGSGMVFIHRAQKEKSMFLPVFTFLFPVIAASVIQMMVPGISLLWAGSAIGLASAYMNLQDESAFTDKMSGLFSRHYLNMHLSTLPERAKETGRTLGIMLDVNDFKIINDTFGHLVGDDAIAAVGRILKAAIPDHRFIFRYAGDEFVVIMTIEDVAEAERVLESIRAETERFNRIGGKPYYLSLSAGYTTYVPGENPNAFVERMDARMYQAKRSHKENSTPE